MRFDYTFGFFPQVTFLRFIFKNAIFSPRRHSFFFFICPMHFFKRIILLFSTFFFFFLPVSSFSTWFAYFQMFIFFHMQDVRFYFFMCDLITRSRICLGFFFKTIYVSACIHVQLIHLQIHIPHVIPYYSHNHMGGGIKITCDMGSVRDHIMTIWSDLV